MIEIETVSTSVYEDLGLPDAAEMQVKATLAAKIAISRKSRPLRFSACHSPNSQACCAVSFAGSVRPRCWSA